MKDLYDVLGVAQDAEDSEIRTAYRKQALRWHPDKNQVNLQYAEEQFKEIQNAYEILSDPQERSWYDRHKDAILRSGDRHQVGGGSSFTGGQRPEDEEDLYAYFTSTCFSGFGDGPRGFYGVYDELYEKLAKQEAEAHEKRADRKGKRPPGPLPRFGLSSAPWPEVSAFYSQWGGFATVKDFSWADQYNPASAPNRKVRRAMEAENEKARRSVKKEYNEAVRNLVGFLKKRDKRVAAWQVEEAKRREEREKEEKARRERNQAERAARLRVYREAEWMRSEEVGPGSSEGDDSEEDEEAAMLVWFCAACDKHFKSEPAFNNHQRSKKHLENVELLKAAFEEEEAELGGSPEGADAVGGGIAGKLPPDSEEEDFVGSTEEDCSLQEGSTQGSVEESAGESEGKSEGEETESGTAGGRQGSGQRSSQRQQQQQQHEQASDGTEHSEEEEEDEDGDDLDEDALLARLVAAQRGGKGQRGGEASDYEESFFSGSSNSGTASESDDSGELCGEGEEQSNSSGSSSLAGSESTEEDVLNANDGELLEAQFRGLKMQDNGIPGRSRAEAGSARPEQQPQHEQQQPLSGVSGPGSNEDEDWCVERRGSKRQGKSKGKVAAPQKAQQESSAGEAARGGVSEGGKLTAKQKRQQRQAGKNSRAAAAAGGGRGGAGDLACSVCGVEFTSRNQLFKHIQSSGHAALKKV